MRNVKVLVLLTILASCWTVTLTRPVGDAVTPVQDSNALAQDIPVLSNTAVHAASSDSEKKEDISQAAGSLPEDKQEKKDEASLVTDATQPSATQPTETKGEASKPDATKQDTPQATEPNQETPKPEEPKQDAPKQDVPKQDVPKQDVPKQDAPKQDVPKQDVPHQDVPKQDVPKQDTPKQDVPKQDDPKQDVPKQDVPQQDVPKQDVPKQDDPKQDDPNQETPKPEEPKQDAPKQDAPKQDVPKANDASTDDQKDQDDNGSASDVLAAAKILPLDDFYKSGTKNNLGYWREGRNATLNREKGKLLIHPTGSWSNVVNPKNKCRDLTEMGLYLRYMSEGPLTVRLGLRNEACTERNGEHVYFTVPETHGKRRDVFIYMNKFEPVSVLKRVHSIALTANNRPVSVYFMYLLAPNKASALSNETVFYQQSQVAACPSVL